MTRFGDILRRWRQPREVRTARLPDEHVINLRDKTVPAHGDLARQFQAEKSRIAAAREQAAGVGDGAAREKLASIDSERVVPEIAALVEAARADPDAALTCGERLLFLRAAVDEVEDALDWPLLVRQARELSDAAREVVTDRGDTEHRRLFSAADAAVRDAITARDPDLLTQRMDDLRVLGSRVRGSSKDRGVLFRLWPRRRPHLRGNNVSNMSSKIPRYLHKRCSARPAELFGRPEA